MLGINPAIICHKLYIDPRARLITQKKKRKLGSKHQPASLEETKKLLKVGFIKEIRFTTWLMKKSSGK